MTALAHSGRDRPAPRWGRRIRALAVAGAAVLGPALVGPAVLGPAGLGSVAQAAPAAPPVPVLGPLAIAPATGGLTTPITVTTGGGCPRGTNIVTRVYGRGFPPAGANVVGNVPTTDYGSPPAPRLVIPLVLTLKEAVTELQPPYRPFAPVGDYRVAVLCQDPLPGPASVHGRYVGTLRIAAGGSYRALTTAADLPSPARPAPGPAPAATPVPAGTPLPTPLPPPNPARAGSPAAGSGSGSGSGSAGDGGGTDRRPLVLALVALLGGAAVVQQVVARLPVRTGRSRPGPAGSAAGRRSGAPRAGRSAKDARTPKNADRQRAGR